jgi:thioredoxin 1
MNEAVLDYFINLFSLLIMGALMVNVFAALKMGYRKLRRSGILILFLLFAGCANGSDPVDVAPAVTPEPTTLPPGAAPSFEDTPEGLESALSSGYPVLLEFTATWCPNCPEQDAIIEDIRSEYTGLVIIYIDVDRYPDTADDYIVGYMPTTLIFNDKGEKVTELIGLTYKEDIVGYLDSL